MGERYTHNKLKKSEGEAPRKAKNLQKAFENKLISSDKLSRVWLENPSICTKIVDLDFNLLYMSDAGINCLEIDDVTQFYGKPFPFDFYPEEFKKELSIGLKKVKETDKLYTLEVAVVSARGNELWFHQSISPVKDDNGLLEYIMVVSINMTEHKRAEAESDRTATLLKNVINTSPDLIFVKDTKLRTILCNNFFSHAVGKENPEELYGKSDIENGWPTELVLGNPDKGIRGYEIDDRAALNGNTICVDSEPVRIRDDIRYFNTTKSPMYDIEGNIIGIVGISRDISERKKAEEELKKLYDELERRVEERTAELTAANTQLKQSKLLAEQATRLKSEFLSNMSHEIRTPMNGVLGVVDLLEDTKLDKTQRHYLHVIKNSGVTLLTVINDILDYSKIEAEMLYLEKSPFSMHQFIDELLAIFRLQSKDQVTLSVESDPAIPELLIGDTTRLNQILSNLLNNAFKFTKKGDIRLQIKLESLDKKCAVINFIVTDTGIGIAPEKLKTLFQAFTQADQSTSREYGGTGLGLAICQRLVDLMDGELTAESKPGVGSSFRFSVSFDIANKPLIQHDSVVSYKQFSSLNVLLAEDNAINQIVIMGMMEKMGVQATMVEDGATAVNLICEQNKHFDIVLMDCEMPTMDGYEATMRIRQWELDNNLSETPIYALTAHALKEHISHSQKVGMNGHLSKPIKMEHLREAFEAVQVASCKF